MPNGCLLDLSFVFDFSNPMSRNTIDFRNVTGKYAASLLPLLLILAFSALMASYHASTNVLYRCDSKVTAVSDFYYHLKVFQHYWNNNAMSPYASTTQSLAVVSLCSHTPQKTLPIGLSPVAVVGMYPATIIDHHSPVLAFGGWLFLSFILFLTGFYSVLRCHLRLSSVWCLLISSATVITPVIRNASGIGQFSIFGTGLLLHLLSHTQKSEKNHLHQLFVFFVLLCLSAKPTYYALGITLLLALHPVHRYRASICGVALITFALLPQVMGLWSFYDQIMFYLSGSQSSHFVESFFAVNQATLVGAFRQVLGWAFSRTISATALSVICALSLIVHNRQSPTICLGAFLILIPYLGFYDDAIALLFLAIPHASSQGDAAQPNRPLISMLLVLVILLALDYSLIRLGSKCLLVLLGLGSKRL